MPIINSILDNDLYKFSMQAIVLDRYPNIPVEYGFIDRRPEGRYTQYFLDALKEEIKAMDHLTLRQDEWGYLNDNFPYYPKSYLSYLKEFRFDSNQVEANLVDGNLKLNIQGLWENTILYEVPLMATISELYFKHIDTNWKFDKKDQAEKIIQKSKHLSCCDFSDFGTRRRRSFAVQDFVVLQFGLFDQISGFPGFTGTSNVHLAQKYDIKPVGTMAHEWIMGVSALEGLRHANRHAIKAWSGFYKGDLGIALTDTYTTDAFLKDFDGYYARLFDGVRHDSGDPLVFANKFIQHYKDLGINPSTKTIVFSDGLTASMASEIQKQLNARIKVSFGIGTHFTNDFNDSKALNIVIKLLKCNGVPLVKLSDDSGKITGSEEARKVALWTFKGEPL